MKIENLWNLNANYYKFTNDINEFLKYIENWKINTDFLVTEQYKPLDPVNNIL